MSYTIFYDASCPLCKHEISLIMKKNINNNLIAAPLDEHINAMKQLNISREDAMSLLGRVLSLNLDTVGAKNCRRQGTKRRSYRYIAKFCNAVCDNF
ncbi:MAG: DUF393 domain-containing protein [Gammaproteobacteria bacterium]|nr:DUF393 domain-containing protein [Gammaproteobacteria bacterium]